MLLWLQMSKILSTRQMINAELAARASNQKSVKALKRHIPNEEQANEKILFNCECSDLKCEARIPLTLEEYEKLHSEQARFVIVKDHLEPSVEKVQKTSKHLAVVDKYAL
jgi:5'-deoxynucleotidase YfbR-like HD superfamily hydrolase